MAVRSIIFQHKEVNTICTQFEKKGEVISEITFSESDAKVLITFSGVS